MGNFAEDPFVMDHCDSRMILVEPWRFVPGCHDIDVVHPRQERFNRPQGIFELVVGKESSIIGCRGEFRGKRPTGGGRLGAAPLFVASIDPRVNQINRRFEVQRIPQVRGQCVNRFEDPKADRLYKIRSPST